MLAGLAVEARATLAGARRGLTGAIVVAGAFHPAGGSVAPGGAGWREPAGRPVLCTHRGTRDGPSGTSPSQVPRSRPSSPQGTRPPASRTLTQLTVPPRPAQAAGAAAVGRMALGSVSAGARVLAVQAKPVVGTAWGQKPGGCSELWPRAGQAPGHGPTSSTFVQWPFQGPVGGCSLPSGTRVACHHGCESHNRPQGHSISPPRPVLQATLSQGFPPLGPAGRARRTLFQGDTSQEKAAT